MAHRAHTPRRTRWGALALVGAAALALVAAAPPGAVAPAPADSATGAREVGTVEIPDEGVRLDRRTRMTASAPAQVTAGGSFTVSGVVRVRAGRAAHARPVRLQERVSGHWRTLVSDRSSRRGSFRIATAATADLGSRTLRVAAPRAGGLRAEHSARVTVRVVAAAPSTPTTPTTPATPVTVPGDWDPAEPPDPSAAAPVGRSDDWSWLFRRGARWDACQVITWAYAPQGSYDTSLADVTRAFARVAGRTGLHFKYVGTTDYVHYVDDADDFPAGVDVTVGWSDEDELRYLAGSTVGVGGGRALPVSGADVAYEMVRGYVVLDREHTLRPGFDSSGSATWGQVMSHEVLHALGLSHAAGADQVMYGSVAATNHLFGAGDISGMSRIGAPMGCLD